MCGEGAVEAGRSGGAGEGQGARLDGTGLGGMQRVSARSSSHREDRAKHIGPMEHAPVVDTGQSVGSGVGLAQTVQRARPAIESKWNLAVPRMLLKGCSNMGHFPAESSRLRIAVDGRCAVLC